MLSLGTFYFALTVHSVVVLPTEDMAAYNHFSTEIVDSLDAQTPLERQFAWTIADNQWRINRIRSIEDGMLGMGHFEAAGDFDAPNPEIHAVMTAAKAFREHSNAFVNLSICEQRLHRALREALRQLKELQAERREATNTEIERREATKTEIERRETTPAEEPIPCAASPAPTPEIKDLPTSRPPRPPKLASFLRPPNPPPNPPCPVSSTTHPRPKEQPHARHKSVNHPTAGL